MWFKTHPWVFPAIIGAIGILYIFINIGAALETKKIQARGSNHHVSGIPILGGIHLLIAGLISPIKWLAVFAALDYTIWMFLYVFFIYDRIVEHKPVEEIAEDKPAEDKKEE